MPFLPARMKLFCVTDFVARTRISFRDLQMCRRLFLYFGALLISLATFANDVPADYASWTIADLQSVVSDRGSVIQSFRIEGWVRAVVQDQQIIVLQDDSSVAFFQLPSVPATIRVGERVELDGKNCSLVRSAFGIRVGAAPVVDRDEHHKLVYKHGSVFLEAGFQPIRLACNNDVSVLGLEYEGPGIQRQKVPGRVLWRKAVDANGYQQGLDVSAYNVNQPKEWHRLSDFEKLNPVANRVVTNFELSCAYSSRTALVFSGYIEIPRDGIYTFYLNSDDVSQLEVGDPAVHCTAIASEGLVMPAIETFDQAFASRNTHQWVEVEGDVLFAGKSQQSMEIDLVKYGDQNLLPITVVEGGSLFYTNLVHRYIRVDGVCEFSDNLLYKKLVGVIVPSPEQVQIIFSTYKKAQDYSSNDFLTTAAQVRDLRPDQANMRIPVKIKGVVIASYAEALILQDSSGGAFVHINNPADWDINPHIGEIWEIGGTSDSGDFCPVVDANEAKYLGDAALPEPVHPTWDQLMNGSIDAEYVELEGVLTGISSNQMTLFTPDGNVTVNGNGWLTLPQMPPSISDWGNLVGSVVKIRGCYTAEWDAQTREVMGGRCYMCPAVMNVEESPPLDLFSLPTKKVADLFWFDARASALQRTKVAGQIIYAQPSEYFILDRGTGARVLTEKPVSLRVGDLVEAVGFPKLGGPSPILLESQVRKIGHASLPEPIRIPYKDLLNRRLDSTLVQITATLVNQTTEPDELVLALQAGPYYFTAKLNSKPALWPTLSVGSLLRVTGVYATAGENRPAVDSYPFELLLIKPADIAVLQQPSWWTVRHSITAAATLGGLLVITFAWITLLQRTLKKRTVQLRTEIEIRQEAEQHRVMEEERIRIARDLHDELGAGLSEVGILGALAKNPLIPPNDKEHYLGQLTESARSLVTGLDEIVWAVNPHYDSVNSLVTYYSLFAQRFLNLAGIACRLQVIEPIPEHSLDTKFRHGLFLAFKEALNNVVRHSKATEVEVKMEFLNDELTVSIRDNGCGIESSACPGQDGLVGMYERLRQLGGECKITSEPAGGTNVKFRIRLKEM